MARVNLREGVPDKAAWKPKANGQFSYAAAKEFERRFLVMASAVELVLLLQSEGGMLVGPCPSQPFEIFCKGMALGAWGSGMRWVVELV
nr:uncharacterized protein LOC109162453 [Ipomoea batatas]GMD59277.1 uncharacterized protein LOC109162453 [Ipomoea batatas]GME07125.1 uncharacterized protein LOC109162453 [Ipomoea batatas]